MSLNCCVVPGEEEVWVVATCNSESSGKASEDGCKLQQMFEADQAAQPTLLPLRVKAKEQNVDCKKSSANLECSRESSQAEQNLLQAAAPQVEGGLDDWLKKWCTAEVLAAFAKASSQDTAVKSLAIALNWRQKHRAVLTGAKAPCWQGDMRVVARAGSGHPVIFMSMAHQPPASNSASIIEHMAAVLEAACQHMNHGAWGFDVVCDCRGFQLSKNLDPRPAIAAMEMLKHAYRGRLRRALVVSAPYAFNGLWHVVKGLLPKPTQEKILFVAVKEAKLEIEKSYGCAAQKVLNLLNHPQDKSSWKFPSELVD